MTSIWKKDPILIFDFEQFLSQNCWSVSQQKGLFTQLVLMRTWGTNFDECRSETLDHLEKVFENEQNLQSPETTSFTYKKTFSLTVETWFCLKVPLFEHEVEHLELNFMRSCYQGTCVLGKFFFQLQHFQCQLFSVQKPLNSSFCKSIWPADSSQNFLNLWPCFIFVPKQNWWLSAVEHHWLGWQGLLKCR